MLEFVEGNFFDYNADIRINTVNCVGVMGAGVALIFKNKFPAMFKEYYRACKENEVHPGQPHVWEDINLFSPLIIINFPTKIHWKNPSKYEYIEKGLIWLREFLLNKEESTVTLPALGCGHGGLDWNRVRELIIKYLGDLKARILVFGPSSSVKKSDFIAESTLNKNNIYTLYPCDIFYPSKLKGKTALEMYYKGNIELLARRNISIITDTKPDEKEKNAIVRFIDELPNKNFVFLLGLSSSYEVDLAKEILSRGFDAIVIVPYGLLNLKIRKDLEPFWDYQKILTLSVMKPEQIWKRYESYNALKFRLSLADITLLNSENINYINKYKTIIYQPDNILFYINYWNSEVAILSKLGAKKIGISARTQKPNILPLVKVLEDM